MKHEKIFIENDKSEVVEAQAPVIISASRATDVPALFQDWFVKRLQKGHLVWKNPFNAVYQYISFQKTRLIVFWSKNPAPIIPLLPIISEIIPNYYFQFTLNNYDNEHFEPNIPSFEERLETFMKLSETIGKQKVIWRFDPLLITENFSVDKLLKKIEHTGNQLKNHTEKLVFSFADIEGYKKVKNNLKRQNIEYLEFNEQKMNEVAEEISKMNKNWNFELATCSEPVVLQKYQISHNKCIDDDLIKKLFPKDEKLMEFIGFKISQKNIFEEEIFQRKNLKDSGQRKFCGCIISKDIGKYNTCKHLCAYCYANVSSKTVLQNYEALKEKNANYE